MNIRYQNVMEGSRKMPPKKKADQVGRALLRRHAGHGPRGKGDIEVKQEPEKKGLLSVLEMNSLDDFLDTALMAQRDFAAIKERDLLILDAKAGGGSTIMSARNKAKQKGPLFKQLKVPRRPAWHTGMTAAELDRVEKDAFLVWRREIAGFEEASGDRAKVTPFEKNLEVWRQLWRVLERSHVVVQIVDARDPLFYYSEDLHAYAGEMNPPRARLILVNKADYLTPEQRQVWARHFRIREWEYAFFSARREQEKLTEVARMERLKELEEEAEFEGGGLSSKGEEEEELDEEEEEDDDDDDEREDDQEEQQQHEEEPVANGDEKPAQDRSQQQAKGQEEESEESRVLSRDELIARLRSLAESAAPVGSQATVGMVGFPNVGKSSVINVLMGVTALDHVRARVAVSSTPGKTKHFQTLPLDESTMLCDCPGLVFPSFVATTADMVCAGVLPINQLRDHMAPVDLVCRRIPPVVLRGYYGLGHKKNEDADDPAASEVPTAREFLEDLCDARGFTAQGSGVPDVNRAARMVLKEYVEGRLVYCHPPPGLSEVEEESFATQTKENMSRLSSRLERRLRDIELEEGDEEAAAEGEEGEGEEEEFEPKGNGSIAESDVSRTTGGRSTLTSSGKVRIRPEKKWGKKGKKLRDKTPYEDDDLLHEKGSGAKIMGRKPLTTGGVGGLFTRVQMPHSALGNNGRRKPSAAAAGDGGGPAGI